jgi:hypothetical protein
LNSLPVTYGERAKQDLAALPGELRSAVLEQLTRVAVNYQTCSRRSSFPRPPGWESGLWVRYSDSRATLVEVLFLITAEPDGITVRRVVVTPLDRLPDWATNPAEWVNQLNWPVVDL